MELCCTLSPEMPLGLLMDVWDDKGLFKAFELHCYSIHIDRRALTLERAKWIKAQGYQLFVLYRKSQTAS